jgi:hypothetical protein
MNLLLQFFGGRGASIGGGSGGGGSGSPASPKSAIQRAAEENAGQYADNPYVQKVAEIYVDASSKDNGREYSMDVNEWEKSGNKRLYLSISERRAKSAGGKLIGKRDYGYVDLNNGQYKPSQRGMSNDLSGPSLYGFSGSKIR